MTIRLMVAYLAISVSFFGSDVFAAAGRTKGDFQVTPSGSAQYAIPIWAPPGIRGLQPTLSLVYDSQLSYGLMGPGWTIGGLSVITRCSRSYAQDGAAAPITLTYTDAFCLDGNRLRLTSSETLSTYGEAGTTYQTEIANFALVTASSTLSGAGPSYFTVQAKDGLTYEYGNTTDSKIIPTGSSTPYVWALDKVTDRAGNQMKFTYYQQGGAYIPLTIQYTAPSGSTSFPYEISFGYTTKSTTDTITRIIAASQIQETNQLSSITVTSSGTTVRKYNLSYTTSNATLRATFTQMQECGGSDGSDCLPATTIGYQSGIAGVSTPSIATGSGGTNGQVFSVDVDGDGRKDLVFATTNGADYEWWVQFATATGYGTPINTGAVTVGLTDFLLDNFDATGGTEILAPLLGGNTWYAYKWNGTDFTATSTGTSIVGGATYSSADVDGDGRPDLVNVVTSGTSFIEGIQLNTTKGGAISFVNTPVTTTTSLGYAAHNIQVIGNNQMPGSAVNHFDFDGDGRQDLILSYNAVVDKNAVYIVAPMLSRGTAAPAFNGGLGSQGNQAVSFLAVNWNDDQCTDLIEGFNVEISACNGDQESIFALPSAPSIALDWDGDGRTDALANVNGTFELYRSEGTTYAPAVSTGIVVSSGSYIVTDKDGDGLHDLVFANSSATNALYYGVHNGAGQHPDLATSFTDGYGLSVKPSYVSIVQSSFSKSTDAVYPYMNWVGPMYVPDYVTYSDPSNMPNGTYQNYYSYQGAWINLQGRGFSGFESIEKEDLRNNVLDTWQFSLAFPVTGQPIGDAVLQYAIRGSGGGGPIRNIAINAEYLTLDATAENQRYYPYAGTTTTQLYEVQPGNAAVNGELVSTTTTTTTVDNYGNATKVATTITDNDPTSPNTGSSWSTTKAVTVSPQANSDWCLNVPTEVQVTQSGSNAAEGGPAITRTVTYTPDYVNCRYTEKVTEPNSSLYKVTEAYTYDSFGNLHTNTVTGVGMAARLTTIDWNSTGQFPQTIYNPLNQAVILGFDPNSGMQTSQTDPNGITTSWTYDDFARKASELRPDGTSTKYAYNSCGTNCVNANNELTVTKNIVYVGGATLTVNNTYLDALDRPLVTSNLMLSGSYNRQEIQYDSFGNIYRVSAPCLFGNCTTYWTTYSYDILNRITGSERPISATNSALQTTSVLYEGRTVKDTDALGNTTTKISLVTGALNRTIDAKGYSVSLGYDAFGSLTSAIDGAQNSLFTAQYSYGIHAFQTSLTDMDSGSRNYTVDALGEITAYSDAKNQQFSITYDALSRPLVRADPDLTTTWTWGSQASSYNIGKLASVTAASSVGTWSDTYSFDNLSRYSSETISNPGDRTYTYVKTYSPTTGPPASLQYPVDISFILTLQYAYSNNILQSISSNSYSPAITYWTANATNARGQVTTETLGNGVVKTNAYDAVTGWLSSVQAGVSGTSTLQNSSYAYDYDGNLTQRQDNNRGLTEDFYYDADNRLTYTTGPAPLQMEYDATGMGNIASRSDVASGAAWTYDPVRKHAVTQAGSSAYTYAYDANGNASSRNGYPITWTSYNLPTGISTATESVQFAYDANRQRWQEIYSGGPNGTETTYRAGKLFEVDNYGGLAHYRHFVYAGSELVSIDDRTTVSTPQYFVVADHQGSYLSILTSNTSADESCPAGYTLSGSSCTETLSQAASTNLSCPAGYTLSGTSCVGTSSVAAAIEYSCPSGYGLSGTTCSKLMTLAATLGYSCPSGYSLSGTTCSETESQAATWVCPPGGGKPEVAGAASPLAQCPNGATGHYTCPSGWTVSGSTCYLTVTQAAASSYSCPAGYTLSGSTCSETLTQAATSSYSCPAGYSLSGTTCSETLTVAATVSYSCPTGYTLSGSTCSETLSVAPTGSPQNVFVAESFTPFGNRRNGETWYGAPTTSDADAINSVSRRGYTGESALGIAMGLNHLNGRVEDSITGRFLSPDPYVPYAGNTGSYNRYSYTNNNPMSRVDPTGFDDGDAIDEITVLGQRIYSGTSDAVGAFFGWLKSLFGGSGPHLSPAQQTAQAHGVALSDLLQSCPSNMEYPDTSSRIAQTWSYTIGPQVAAASASPSLSFVPDPSLSAPVPLDLSNSELAPVMGLTPVDAPPQAAGNAPSTFAESAIAFGATAGGRGVSFHNAFYRLLNLVPNTTKSFSAWGNTVFDAVASNGTLELKSGQYITMSSQLRAQLAIAAEAKVPPYLAVSPTSTVSAPVVEAFREGGGAVVRFNSATGAFTSLEGAEVSEEFALFLEALEIENLF